ncbi:hypothetical protein IFVP136_C280107 [Vibrio parahaemolyticus]
MDGKWRKKFKYFDLTQPRTWQVNHSLTIITVCEQVGISL